MKTIGISAEDTSRFIESVAFYETAMVLECTSSSWTRLVHITRHSERGLLDIHQYFCDADLADAVHQCAQTRDY